MAYDSATMGPEKKTQTPYAAQGERLREARESNGIDQADLARRVGVEPGTYWRYEAGERSPSRKRMDAIVAIIGKTPDWFFKAVPAAPPPLTRGEAFQRIEDDLNLDESGKARVRALISKYKTHQLNDDYLEAVADIIRHPGISDSTAHSSAVMVATDASARRSSAKKLRKPKSDAPARNRKDSR